MASQVVLNGHNHEHPHLHAHAAEPAIVHPAAAPVASSASVQPAAPPVVSNAAAVANTPQIKLGGLHLDSIDDKFHRLASIAAHPEASRVLAETPQAAALIAPSATTPPPLGPLAQFVGTFAGLGFNTIFRPNNATPTPGFPNDALLELNLTSETLAFSPPLGKVFNRGFGDQPDVILNGVPYAQTINDISDLSTGKTNPNLPTNIHFEPGLWMHNPATQDPNELTSLIRMGSIPHGTTINAQGSAPPGPNSGPPQIPAVDITPFPDGGGKTIPFPQQQVTNATTSRLPQDLTLFNSAGTITQAILDDPNQVLRNAIAGQTITQTTTFTVATFPQKVANPLSGGGTANINFLSSDTKGSGPTHGNANAVSMTATFWIETVQYQLTVPPFTSGQTTAQIKPKAPNANVPLPTFEVHIGSSHITSPVTIKVNATQIQYSQQVVLNFNGLSWPHASVATLVPQAPIPVVLSSG